MFFINKNNSDNKDISFHSFPKDKLTLDALDARVNFLNDKGEDFVPRNNSRICSAHFLANATDGKKQLRKVRFPSKLPTSVSRGIKTQNPCISFFLGIVGRTHLANEELKNSHRKLENRNYYLKKKVKTLSEALEKCLKDVSPENFLLHYTCFVLSPLTIFWLSPYENVYLLPLFFPK